MAILGLSAEVAWVPEVTLLLLHGGFKGAREHAEGAYFVGHLLVAISYILFALMLEFLTQFSTLVMLLATTACSYIFSVTSICDDEEGHLTGSTIVF